MTEAPHPAYSLHSQVGPFPLGRGEWLYGNALLFNLLPRCSGGGVGEFHVSEMSRGASE